MASFVDLKSSMEPMYEIENDYLCGRGHGGLGPACLVPHLPCSIRARSLLLQCVLSGFPKVLNTINYGELFEPLFLYMKKL